MKKRLSILMLSLAAGVALASCSGEKQPELTTSVTSTEKGTESGNTTTAQAAKRGEMPEFHSSYTAKMLESMPTIKIQSESNSLDFVTRPQNQPKECFVEPWYEKCTVQVGTNNQTELTAEAEVKVRGNWTTSYAKKPLRIKFSDKQSMLGLNEGKKAKNWVLLASYKDWSMVRDGSGLYLSHLMSRNYTSDFQLVNVEINGEYWGVYLLAEQQQVNKNRINITAPEKDYAGTDIGYFIEFDGYYSEEENNFGIDYFGEQWDALPMKDIENTSMSEVNFQRGYTIKSDITNDSQKDFIRKYMNNLWAICYEATVNKVYYEFDSEYGLKESTTKKDTYEAVKDIIDLESLVDTYILQELICDPDIYWSSFYMDVDFGKDGDQKLRFEAPWDFDSTMGNKERCPDGTGLYAAKLGWDVNHQRQCANPWMMVFIHEDWFQSMVKSKWKMMNEDKIFDKVYTYIDFCSSTYTEDFKKNYEKWNNIGRNDLLGNELYYKAANCRTEKEAADYLKGWLKSRVTFLNNTWK